MNPEEAKTKITQLLDLGTLQGVKVESNKGEITNCYKIDFEPALPDVIWYTTKSIQNRTPHPEMFYFTMDTNNIPPFLRDVASIHPIPLQPKLLEVGDRVKIISGVYEGKIGVINTADKIQHYSIIIYGTGATCWVELWNVVPESLLVEEEETKLQFIGNNNQYIYHSLKEVEEALNQAGYKVTKE